MTCTRRTQSSSPHCPGGVMRSPVPATRGVPLPQPHALTHPYVVGSEDRDFLFLGPGSSRSWTEGPTLSAARLCPLCCMQTAPALPGGRGDITPLPCTGKGSSGTGHPGVRGQGGWTRGGSPDCTVIHLGTRWGQAQAGQRGGGVASFQTTRGAGCPQVPPPDPAPGCGRGALYPALICVRPHRSPQGIFWSS